MPGTSLAMGGTKVENIVRSGAEVVVSNDISCLMHIGGILQRNPTTRHIRTTHIAEVLVAGWEEDGTVMLNFTYHNPVKIVFGKGAIAELPKLVPAEAKVLLTYGGGSIKRNGVYEQVIRAMQGRSMIEFGGIEPNPRYETCLKAVELARAEGVDFLLAVGGGSVIDGTKFIAAAVPYQGGDPWDMLLDWSRVPANPLPLGCVLTLPATGSEMNGGAVISREATQEKLFFVTPANLPPLLDPRSGNDLQPAAAADGQRHRRRLRSHDRAIPDLSGRRPAAGSPGRGDSVDADRRGPEGAWPIRETTPCGRT